MLALRQQQDNSMQQEQRAQNTGTHSRPVEVTGSFDSAVDERKTHMNILMELVSFKLIVSVQKRSQNMILLSA